MRGLYTITLRCLRAESSVKHQARTCDVGSLGSCEIGSHPGDFPGRAIALRGLRKKTKPRRFIAKISLADGALQIRVERLVSDPHCTVTQLDRSTVFAGDQLIMLKALLWVLGCRLGRFLERRLAGRNRARKTLAKHADRAEFHGSGKLVTATRAGALGLRVHG